MVRIMVRINSYLSLFNLTVLNKTLYHFIDYQYIL